MDLRTLAGGLGCFPLDHETHLPQSDCRALSIGIRSLVGFGKLAPPSPSSALPPILNIATLALKLFRGEQAISKFVWHFTPTHSSSLNFATLEGSALHESLVSLHPAHG